MIIPVPASEPAQTARFERKREAILEAAAALFNAQGLAGTTIADVAKAVGLTTTSVTYYYRKKEDLAAACLMRAIGAMDDLLSQAEGGAAHHTPAERLTRFVRLYFSHLADTAAGRAPPLINFWDLRGMTGPQGAAPMQAFVALFRRMRQLFQGGGSAFSRNEQNARAHLVFAAVIGAKTWVRRYETDDYLRAADRFADVLVGGLAGAGSIWAPPAIDVQRPNLQRPPAGRRRGLPGSLPSGGHRADQRDRLSRRLGRSHFRPLERHQGVFLPPQRH